MPEAARSLVYVRALNHAIRSPLTWLIGASVFMVFIAFGATQGRAMFGTAGAVLGVAIGAGASIWCFFRAVLPWRVRRLLPSVIAQADNTTLEEVRKADDRVKRMGDAYKKQDRLP